MKLITGHIMHTMIADMANVIIIGLSHLGSTILKARYLAKWPTIKNSKIKAITPIIGNSFKASKNT